MKKLVFATNNAHKLSEVRQILSGTYEVLSLNDINCHEELPETQDTLEENALEKARYVKEHYDYDCFADDTGLEVNSLDGAPGVYSARYASMPSDFNADGGNLWGAADDHDSDANMRKLLHSLSDKADRSAQFRTVIALIKDGEEHLFEGIVKGTITSEKSGKEGFGYDPIFQPEGHSVTFAEMSSEEKNHISHRGRATEKLAAFLKLP